MDHHELAKWEREREPGFTDHRRPVCLKKESWHQKLAGARAFELLEGSQGLLLVQTADEMPSIQQN